MKKLVASILALFFMVGCATTFTHPTKTQADFEQDKYECERIAVQYAADMGAEGNPLIISEQMSRCLQLKYGWQVVK